MSTLAERINQRMNDLKLTQAELARQAKVKPPSVAQWRNGHTKTLSGDVLLRTATVLSCFPQWLATGVGPMQANLYEPPGQTRTEEAALQNNVIKTSERRATRWPFRRISREKIEALSLMELSQLEGAWSLAAAQLRIDVDVQPPSAKKKKG
jgi:transcriptional regulator with XRE-family HTH domain